METINLVLCGVGGQGILLMTKVLAHTALRNGFKVMGAETHGMAQRGGSVVSHLRLGDFKSSLVKPGSAHFLLALEDNEAYRNIPFLTKGGKLYVNVSNNFFPQKEVKEYFEKKEIVCKPFPAGKIAMDLEAPMSTNLALLGFFSAFEEGLFSYREVRETINQVSPDRFKKVNLKVFDTCVEKGTKA